MFHILELVMNDKDFLLKKEQEYINRLKPEYNISHYTEANMRGMKHSEESKLKMSIKAKGRIAWNKGIKSIHFSQRTEFKKGQIGFWTGKKRMNMTGENNPMFNNHVPTKPKNGKIINCFHCGKEIYKSRNELKNTKSGLLFCSNECSNYKRILN